MKILLLVNWHIEYGTKPNDAYLPSDYCYDKKFWFFKYFKEPCEVDVIDTRSFKWIEKIEKKYLRIYLMQTLRVLPRLKNYDLIISHGTTSGIFLDLLRSVLKLKTPPHITVDISSFHKASESGMIYNLCRKASKKIDFLIYHTSRQKSYFEKHFPWLDSKREFVHFGIDGEYWEKKQYKKTENKEPFILCVGYRKRDWDTLIEAYKKSSQKYKLYLIGNESIKVEHENIEILPFMKLDDLMQYITDSYCCVLPLEYMPYSFGQMTLLQEMIMGKAVITAKVPSVMDYDSDGLIWYESQNIDDLVEKMEWVFEHPIEIEKLGIVNKNIVRNKYSARKMANEFEKICLKVVNSK